MKQTMVSAMSAKQMATTPMCVRRIADSPSFGNLITSQWAPGTTSRPRSG